MEQTENEVQPTKFVTIYNVSENSVSPDKLHRFIDEVGLGKVPVIDKPDTQVFAQGARFIDSAYELSPELEDELSRHNVDIDYLTEKYPGWLLITSRKNQETGEVEIVGHIDDKRNLPVRFEEKSK